MFFVPIAASDTSNAIAGFSTDSTRRQRFLSTCPPPVSECTATVIPCSDLEGEDTAGSKCWNVPCTITAFACSGFDTAEAADKNEEAVRSGNYAAKLVEVAQIVATVILPPSEEPSSEPSSGPSISIAPSSNPSA